MSVAGRGEYDVHLTCVFADGVFTEGPTFVPGGVLFSDIRRFPQKGRILRFDLGSRTTSVALTPSGMSNGIAWDRRGFAWIAQGADGGSRSISTWKPGQLPVSVVNSFRGSALNSPNDLFVLDDGGIVFSDPRYNGDERRSLRFMGVFHLTRDRRVRLLASGLGRPNGVALDRFGSRVLIAVEEEAGEKQGLAPFALRGGSAIVAFPLSFLSSEVSLREVSVTLLADLDKKGSADGLKVTEDGLIWAALFNRRSILILNPNGKEVGEVFVPESPTNLAIRTTADGYEGFITAGRSLYELRITPKQGEEVSDLASVRKEEKPTSHLLGNPWWKPTTRAPANECSDLGVWSPRINLAS